MRDDFDYIVSCPFCHSEDVCKHLVASLDFGNAAIGGGFCFDREDDLSAIVRSGFEAVVTSLGESIAWARDREFDNAWDDFITRRNAGERDPLDRGALVHLLHSLLRNTDAEWDCGVGLTAFYSQERRAIYDQVVADFRKACADARAKP